MNVTKVIVRKEAFQMKFKLIIAVFAIWAIVLSGSNVYAQVGEWVEIATFSPLNMPGVAALGQKIYIIGGSLGGEAGPHTNNVRIFDTSTNTWDAEGSPMPTARYALALAVSGDKLYAIGGGTGYAIRTNAVEQYDPTSDSWVVKNHMRVARQELGTATVNGKIYVIGGDIVSANTNAVEEFDPLTNTWTDKAPYNPAPQVRSSAAALGQYVYVFGGFFGWWGDSVSVFDTVANVWDHSRKMPNAQVRHGVCQLNGMFYIAAGHEGGAYGLDTFWQYNPNEDDWISLPSLPQGSYNVDLVSANNQLFLVDGNHGKIYTFIYTPSVDIKPGDCPNPVNVKSKGDLPVAILGTEDFDVFMIDPASIRLAGVAAVRSSYEDVATPVSDGAEICECTTNGPDGYIDLTLKFETQEIVAALGELTDGDELELTLTGTLNDGSPIEGKDCIVVISKGKPK